MTTNNVAKQSALVQAMAVSWPMIDALMGGTAAMRAAGEMFLPKWPNEDSDSYQARLKTSVLHPAFSKTVRVMAAKPFIQEVTYTPDLPAQLSEIEEDCDCMGTGVDEFFADRFVEALSHGITGVFVDKKGGGGRTLAEEKKSGARPYFCVYPASSFLGWRVEDHKLTMVRLLERVTEQDGEFDEQSIEQVRVLRVGAWETWRKNEKGDWVKHEEGVTGLTEIPFVFFYGSKLGYGHGVSPLLDLAYQNVEHWQSSSDQQSILHVARVPILFAKGFGDGKGLTIGAGIAASSDNAEADLRWVEHSGKAIEAGAKAIADLEERMRQAGAELLVKRSGNVTATQVMSENEANRSTLQNMVEEFEESVALCLYFAGKWQNTNYSPDVEIYKDFAVGASDADMEYILKAEEREILSKEEVKQEMVRRNMIVIDDESPPVKTESPQAA